MRRIRRFFQQLARLRKEETLLDAELQFHIESHTQDLIEQGVTPAEARRRARMELGGLEQVKEQAREQRLTRWVEDLFRDLVYAGRMMRKSPVLSVAAILSLALGIGANTAIFSLLDSLLLRSLPVHAAGELNLVFWRTAGSSEGLFSAFTGSSDNGKNGSFGNAFSYPAYTALAEQGTTRGVELAGFSIPQRVSATVNGRTQLIDASLVTGNYHQLLRVLPERGRLLQPSDDTAGAAPVAVLSYGFWMSQLGGDPGVVGRTIKINAEPFEIAGVTRPEFFGHQIAANPDVTLALRKSAVIEPEFGRRDPFNSADYWWVQLLARVPARQNMRMTADQLSAALTGTLSAPPKSAAQTPFVTMEPAARGLNDVRGDFERPLYILMSVVVVVLLIASANVANLLIARAIARQRETSIRLSIGASRGRLIRQFLAEFLLLALAAGALSIVLAQWIASSLVPLVPSYQDVRLNTGVDLRLLSFTGAVVLLVTLVFGMIPALRATGSQASAAMKENAGSLGSVGSRFDVPRVLIALQVALSLLLLGAASLFVSSLRNLNSIDLGYPKENLVMFHLDPAQVGFHQDRLVGFYLNAVDNLKAIPGVIAASASNTRPITGGGTYDATAAAGTAPMTFTPTRIHESLPGYTDALGIPLIAGRGLTLDDRKGSPNVVLINQTLSRKLFGDRNPVGQWIRRGRRNGSDFQVVGVVKDARYEELKKDYPPILYSPFLQRDPRDSGLTFVVRTRANPAALMPAIQQAIAKVSPEVPLGDVRTQEQQIEQFLRRERLFAILCSAFGGLALLLSAIGNFGVMTSLANRRRNELGLRLALGATRGDVIWLVLRSGLAVVMLGIAVGLPAALYLSRFVDKFLYGVKPTDPVAISAAALVLLAIAAFAAWLPAFRASRWDPLKALRYE